MPKYISESEFTGGKISFETGLTKEFGELEIFGTLMQYKKIKKSFWENIGVGGSVAGPALINQDSVYFGACDSNFYALNLDGSERWRFKTGGPLTVGASIWQDIIYVSSTDRNLYALEKQSGKLIWKLEIGYLVWGLTVHKNRLYLGAGDGNLYALDAASGEIIWKFKTRGSTMSPLVKEDRIYFGYDDHNFYALTLDGHLLWRFAAGDKICAWFQPVSFHNTLYFGCFDSNLYAINTDGQLRWKVQVGDTAYPPVIWQEKVYFGSRDFNVYCVNAKSGNLIWKFKTGGFVGAGMAASAGKVYFGSHDNNVYCADALTGKEIWRFKTNGFVNFVTVYENRICCGSWDCNLYCLDLNGKLLWKFPTSLSYPAPIKSPEQAATHSVQIIWTPVFKEEKKKYKPDETDIADYGTFSGKYVDISKSDYLGRKKKGYM